MNRPTPLLRATQPSWWLLVTGSVLLGILWLRSVGVSARLFPHALPAASNGPFPLVASDESLDMGDVWADQVGEVVIPLRNRTDAPVKVAAISASCDCTNVTPSTFVIPARGEQEVRLTVDGNTQVYRLIATASITGSELVERYSNELSDPGRVTGLDQIQKGK